LKIQQIAAAKDFADQSRAHFYSAEIKEEKNKKQEKHVTWNCGLEEIKEAAELRALGQMIMYQVL